MALTGLVFGYIGVSIIPILIIAAIAIPNLLRSRIAANEASAVGAIRTINTAQITYASMFPRVGYACDLTSLGGKEGAPQIPQAAGLIDATLSAGQKSGYRFALQCKADNYYVVARPVQPGSSGKHIFCSDGTAVIRYSTGTSAGNCFQDGTPLQ